MFSFLFFLKSNLSINFKNQHSELIKIIDIIY